MTHRARRQPAAAGFASLIATVLILVVVVGAAVHQRREFRDRCQAAGGHTSRIDHGRLCLAPDGRVIDL